MGLGFWLTHIIIRIFLWFVWQDWRSSYIPIWIFNSDDDSLTSGASKYPLLTRAFWLDTPYNFPLCLVISFHFITSFSCQPNKTKRFKFVKYDLELEALVRNRIQNQPFAKFGKCVSRDTSLVRLILAFMFNPPLSSGGFVSWWAPFDPSLAHLRGLPDGVLHGTQIFFKQHAYIVDFVESIWWTCSCFIHDHVFAIWLDEWSSWNFNRENMN